MSTLTSAVAAPFRLGAEVARAVGGAASMLFTRGFARWSILWSRTRIDYRSEVGDPLNNSIVGSVVGWISRNFPEAPLRIVRTDESGDPVNIGPRAFGPGKLLRLMENPNAHFSGPLQMQALIADYMIGNAYLIKVRADDIRGNRQRGTVEELWWVPSSMMEPRWPENDPSVFISHYRYTVDGIEHRIDPRDVVHLRNGLDPKNPRKGLSRLGSCLREIWTDDEAAQFTATLLRNLGVPGVIISPANTTGGGPMRMDGDAVKKDFKERFSGDNRGEPMVMKSATDIKVLSWSPQQLNLRELRRIPEERVSAVTGVPAGVAGLGAGLDRNTFSNYGEANKAAMTQGVIPLYRLIAADLERQLLPDFEPTEADGGMLEQLDVYFDWTVTAAMQDALGEVWKRNESAAIKGLQTRADWKVAVGKKPAPDGSDDVYIYPSNYLIRPADAAPDAPPTAPRRPSPDPREDTEPVALNGQSTNGNGHHRELTGAPA